MKMSTVTTGTTDIAHVLQELGVDVRRVGDREISGCCPVHERTTGKADRSPSWSMNAISGLWICHSCGARGTLSSLVSELSGNPDSVMAVNQLLMESGLNRLKSGDAVPYVPDVDWITYNRFGHPPVRECVKRNIDPDVAKAHGIRWNYERSAWIIPIVSPLGELMGWQEKGSSWFNNTPKGVKKGDTLFGVERFIAKTALLVESPLDVVRFASAFTNVQALATFGAYVTTKQLNVLSTIASRIIVAMDNDKTGIESAKNLFKSLPRFKNGVLWFAYGKSEAKDIGDMTDDEVEVGLRDASVVPWWLT